MLTLHIEADTYDQLVEQALKRLNVGSPAVTVDAPLAPPVDTVSKGKPGRPSKPKMEEAIAANTAAVAPAPVVTPPVPTVTPDPFVENPTPSVAVTFDQVKSALQKLAVLREGEKDPQVGYNRVGAIISKFGVDKVKNLKPEQYAAVLEACGQA